MMTGDEKNKDKTAAVPTESELKLFMTPARSKQLRSRLSDISWWMRALKAREKVRKRQASRSRSKVTARVGQANYVRGDECTHTHSAPIAFLYRQFTFGREVEVAGHRPTG